MSGALDVEVNIRGLQELEARLLEFGALTAQRVLRRILRKTATPLQHRAAANAQSIGRSNSLAASVQTITTKRSGENAAQVTVAPRYRSPVAIFVHNAYYERKRKGIFHGHFLEWGHRIGTRKGRLRRESRALTEKGLARYAKKRAAGKIKGAAAAGEVQARPWFGPAVSATSPIMPAIFEAELRAAVKRLERRRGMKSVDPDAVSP